MNVEWLFSVKCQTWMETLRQNFGWGKISLKFWQLISWCKVCLSVDLHSSWSVSSNVLYIFSSNAAIEYEYSLFSFYYYYIDIMLVRGSLKLDMTIFCRYGIWRCAPLVKREYKFVNMAKLVCTWIMLLKSFSISGIITPTSRSLFGTICCETSN